MSASPQSPTPLSITLREVTAADIAILYQHQLDPEGNEMAGTKPRPEEAFHAHWTRVRADPNIVARVIERDGVVVGGISCFVLDGAHHVGYWIARDLWGKGIASAALAMLLKQVGTRPLHATTNRSNAPSMRILEKCGFRLTGFSQGEETDRFLPREIAHFILDEPSAPVRGAFL